MHSATREAFSIGHSNHSIEHFLGLLTMHGIEAVADVRTRPFASYSRHFDGEPLRLSLRRAGVHYVFLGYGLGGKPGNLSYYDENGHVCYDRCAATESFAEALGRLQTGLERFHTAMMCGEENPFGCHRRLLVGRVLAEQGVVVRHIRGDGRLQTDAEVIQEALGPKAFQQELFGDEWNGWRSHWRLSQADRERMMELQNAEP